MLSFGGTTADTAEDQRRYLDARLVEVACLDCTARARVRKNSPQHTSVQWSSADVAACVEFQQMSHQTGGRRVHTACPRMMVSIERAVEDGIVEIGAVDGY